MTLICAGKFLQPSNNLILYALVKYLSNTNGRRLVAMPYTLKQERVPETLELSLGIALLLRARQDLNL